jgi:hypothetical protein
LDWLAASIHMPADPVVDGVNPPKRKLFSVVACPKTSVAEFSHPLNQTAKRGVSFDSFHFLSISDGSKCLFAH